MSNNRPLTEEQQNEIREINATLLKKLLDDHASTVAKINRSRKELLEATRNSDPMIIQKHAQVNLLAQKYIAIVCLIKLIDMTSARDVAINVQQFDIALREYRQQLDLYKRDQRIGAKSADEIELLEKEWDSFSTLANNIKNILIDKTKLLAVHTSPTLEHLDTDEVRQLSGAQQLLTNIDSLNNINTSNKIFVQLYDLYREILRRRKNIFLYIDSGDTDNKRDENLRELKQLSAQFIEIIKHEWSDSDDEMKKWLITFKLEQILLPTGFINSVEKSSESDDQLHRLLVKRESEQTNLPNNIVEILLQLPRDNEVLEGMMNNHFASNTTTESASTDDTWFSSLINFFQNTEEEDIIQEPTAKKNAMQSISIHKIANLTAQIISISRDVTVHWKTPTDLNELVKLKKQIEEIKTELSNSSLLEHRISLELNRFKLTDVNNLSANNRLKVLGGILDHLLFDAYQNAFNEAYKKFDASSLRAAEKNPTQIFKLKQAISDMEQHINNLPQSLQSVESFGVILGYVPPSIALQNREQNIRDDMVAKLADAKRKITPLNKKYRDHAATETEAAKSKQTKLIGQTHPFTPKQLESIGMSPEDLAAASSPSAGSRSLSGNEQSAGRVPLQQKNLAERTTEKHPVGNKEINGFLIRLRNIRNDITKMIQERDSALKNTKGIDPRQMQQRKIEQRSFLSEIQTKLEGVNKEWRDYKSTHVVENENVTLIDTLFKTIKAKEIVQANDIINSNKTSDQYKPATTTVEVKKANLGRTEPQ